MGMFSTLFSLALMAVEGLLPLDDGDRAVVLHNGRVYGRMVYSAATAKGNDDDWLVSPANCTLWIA